MGFEEFGSGFVTHCSEKTLGFLYGSIATKESNKHHHSTDSNQDVDTYKKSMMCVIIKENPRPLNKTKTKD